MVIKLSNQRQGFVCIDFYESMCVHVHPNMAITFPPYKHILLIFPSRWILNVNFDTCLWQNIWPRSTFMLPEIAFWDSQGTARSWYCSICLAWPPMPLLGKALYIRLIKKHGNKIRENFHLLHLQFFSAFWLPIPTFRVLC